MDDYTFIDLDGVILDSEEMMLKRKYDLGLHNHNCKDEFDQYFTYTQLHPEEWDYIIREAKSINNSVEIIRELENLKRKIAIITKCHTQREEIVKADDLRNNRKIKCPIFFVPPGVKKHEIVIPRNKQLLIDDSRKNICLWKDNGGTGLIFDKTLENDTKEKVKSLEFLLKR